MFSPNQDIIFQEVKLFIEGVQVPFTSIQVTSGIGGLPSASISIPPFPGLMDICRYYQPKVHIFYTDSSLEGGTKPEESNKRECVLFIGHIAGVSFSRSRAGGYSQVTFSCNHKNALLGDVLVDFTDPTTNTMIGQDTTTDSSVKMNGFGSDWSIHQALNGITSKPPPSGANANETAKLNNQSANAPISIEINNSDKIKANPALADPSVLNSRWYSAAYSNRFKGFPGVLMNLWNQLKLSPVRSPDDFESMISLYLPLIEDGIKFFDRLSGHYYVENLMDTHRVDRCQIDSKGTTSNDSAKHLCPPGHRLFVQSSIQSEMSIRVIESQLGFSGELTDFLSMFRRLLESIDYDYITLTSPAESAFDPETPEDGNTQALETIIKPELPFYYSPNCNIYYPYMYHSINIQQDEASIPTRITLQSAIMPTAGNSLHKNYRAPFSVREAIVKGYSKDMQDAARARAEAPVSSDPASPPPSPPDPKEVTQKQATNIFDGQNLESTTDGIKNKTRVGEFEFGRGIRHRKYPLPYWLSMYSSGVKQGAEIPSMSQADKDSLNLLLNAWNYRFGKDKEFLNPYSPDSGVLPYERLLFSAADYRFTKEVASSKMGSLSGVFNPYIIPGYPMDILDPDPVNPCFHAMCASVTHNITARSISTDVSFVAAITYTELANYYLQYVNPWLQVNLKIVTGQGSPSYPQEDISPEGSSGSPVYPIYTSSIVDNPEAAKLAEEEFYYPTLGVGALAPDDLYNFEDGTLKPIQVVDSIRHGESREENPMLSAQGNLLLVWRPIETREKIETRFGLTFIDMEEHNYNPNVIKYTDEQLDETSLLEPGQSQFLEYSDAPGTVTVSDTSSNSTEVTKKAEATTTTFGNKTITATTTTTTSITNDKGDIKETVKTDTQMTAPDGSPSFESLGVQTTIPPIDFNGPRTVVNPGDLPSG